MKDILVFGLIILAVYIFARFMMKLPILPWKEPKKKQSGKPAFQQKKQTKENDEMIEEEDVQPFQNFFSEIENFDNHMIRSSDNNFTMVAEVEPVNYFLLDHEEQESIDVAYETWLAQFNYPVRIYLQSRFVDLTEPIEEIQLVMKDQDDMHPNALEFGQNMIDNLRNWQQAQPRYETKRYILFDYKVEVKDIRAENEEELEEKIIDKAFNELQRRVSSAKQQLRKADMNVMMLTTDGIGEMLYYLFNRRKAVKNRYRDIERQEQLSLYVTADQTAERIALVKGEIELVQKNENNSAKEHKEEVAS